MPAPPFRRRWNPLLRSAERRRDSQEHARRREDISYRQGEQERNTLEHAIRRESQEYRMNVTRIRRSILPIREIEINFIST